MKCLFWLLGAWSSLRKHPWWCRHRNLILDFQFSTANLQCSLGVSAFLKSILRLYLFFKFPMAVALLDSTLLKHRVNWKEFNAARIKSLINIINMTVLVISFCAFFKIKKSEFSYSSFLNMIVFYSLVGKLNIFFLNNIFFPTFWKNSHCIGLSWK